MESLEHALRLTRLGRFGDALHALEQARLATPVRARADVLRAELLERVGRSEQATALATTLLKSEQLTASQRSECEAVLGRVLFDEGDTEGGQARLQRAALIAQQANDFHALFGAKLPLLGILYDRSGPAAGSTVLAEVRQIATKLGDPEITARLHLFVAAAEAKRGLLENAKRHTSLARRILTTSPNAYLEAFTSNLDVAVAVLRSEFDVGKACGVRAVELAEQSGVAKIRRAVLGNMGNLFYELGDFDSATSYFENALAAPPANGADTTAILESLARVHLIQGRGDSCSAALDRIESSIHVEQDRLSYENRYAALTRIHLLAWQGQIEQALSRTDSVLELATNAGDGLLLKQVQLTKAELLQRIGLIPSSMELIAAIVPGLVGVSPELYARSEQILACALALDGDSAGEAHHDRALRIYRALGSVPRQRELAFCWNQARESKMREGSSSGRSATVDVECPEVHGARRALHGIAAALTHAARPDLVAHELLEVLAATDCTYTSRATVRGASDTEEVICELNSGTSYPDTAERRLSVGFRGDREVQVFIRPKPNVESVASVNAMTLLLASLHEVQRGRAEREERATLWPIEELPVDDEGSVISGRMRELMNYARRIAKTKVNVLITGESGTGKEILARAIHNFSDRAHKAFVPLNCTAIPRDLLESQLFGHRRGAFTGADRDQLGLIRAASDGTLFLDEIGALGLDLQPKLLRFLESGEISPLGAPGSMTIDVRIVAATNTNLEDAVNAGTFREDLFYRLNVVRLSIPPLRERRDEIPGFVNHFVSCAAEEFKKGHLRVAEETMERLLLYRWPGNVRQLQNEMRRMVALADADSTLLPSAISDQILGALPIFRHAPINGHEITVDLHDKLLPTIARIECEMIKAALRTHHGKVDAAAKALGISRKGLYLKRQRLGL
jgi:DNA-binding NtrC family response regulator/tetratricopeptide (TPR) repeat protein